MKRFIKYALAAISTLGIVSLALAQTATSTLPMPLLMPVKLFKPVELNINPEGKFLAHGMIVESVSGNSFVGKVWGTSWTVNIVNVLESKFLLQNGVGIGQTVLSSVLKSGDEVGVSGWVDQNNALTVNGQVIRNYSLGNMREFKNRKMEIENEQGNDHGNTNGKENNQNNQQQGGNQGEDNKTNVRSSSIDNQNAISDIQQQIKNILEQIKLLQGGK